MGFELDFVGLMFMRLIVKVTDLFADVVPCATSSFSAAAPLNVSAQPSYMFYY